MASSRKEDVAFDLEELVDLEQQFYDEGYKDGFEHGQIHGRIEGQELGRQKGFEMWEELGFYEGFARTWKTIYERKEGEEHRVTRTAKTLLDLIAQFPMTNPPHDDTEDSVDFVKLFNQIRSRYKMLCAFVGVRPSLRSSGGSQSKEKSSSPVEEPPSSSAPKKQIWKIDNADDCGGSGADMSY